MSVKKSLQKVSIYKYRRYWYHVSSTLKKDKETLIPWDEENGFNRGEGEPEGNRICVAPSIEQCITAIPYHLSQVLNIYRTKEKVKPHPPEDVFDANVTQEGWLLKTTEFIKIGKLDFQDVEKSNRGETPVISESASGNSCAHSGKVLKWWQRKKIKRFIKKT